MSEDNNSLISDPMWFVPVGQGSLNPEWKCSNFTSIQPADQDSSLYALCMIFLSLFNLVINISGLVFCYRYLKSNWSSGGAINSAQTSHKSTLGLLIRLACVEIAFNFCVLWHFLLTHLSEHKFFTFKSLEGVKVVTFLQNLSISFMVGFQCMRNWTVVFIALLRMLAVLSPHAWFPKCSKHLQSWLYIAFIFFFLLLTAPRSFEFQYIVCVDSLTILKQQASVLLKDQYYSVFYLTVGLFIMQSGGPIILVAVFSLVLSQMIMQGRRRRQRIGNPTNKRPTNSAQVNKTVITLSIIFFIFETPTFLSKLDVALNLIDVNSPASAYLMYTGNIMTCLDSTLNVIIYILANPKIKESLHELCSRCYPSDEDKGKNEIHSSRLELKDKSPSPDPAQRALLPDDKTTV